MTGRIGCMRCGNFDDPIHHRADLPDQAMLCDRCARLVRQAKRLSEVLGVKVEPPRRESYVEVDGRTYVLDEELPDYPVLRDDGATNAMWCGPEPMPQAMRDAGWVGTRDENDDDDAG